MRSSSSEPARKTRSARPRGRCTRPSRAPTDSPHAPFSRRGRHRGGDRCALRAHVAHDDASSARARRSRPLTAEKEGPHSGLHPRQEAPCSGHRVARMVQHQSARRMITRGREAVHASSSAPDEDGAWCGLGVEERREMRLRDEGRHTEIVDHEHAKRRIFDELLEVRAVHVAHPNRAV